MKRLYLVFILLLIPSIAVGATSRVLPTSYNTSTYGAAGNGRDYTVLATWEAATDTNLVTAADGEILNCYPDSTVFNDSVNLSGATTNASYFRVVKAAPGHENDGLVSASARFEKTNLKVGIFQCNENYSSVYDISAKATDTSTGALDGSCGCFWTFANGNRVAGCIAYNSSSSQGAQMINFYHSGSGTSYYINNLAYNTGPVAGFFNGDFCSYGSGTMYIYNGTVVDGAGTGYNNVAGTMIATNCIAEDNGTNWTGTITKTTCTDDDGVVFVGGVDYHLSPTDTVAIGQGTNLSATFTDDIDGDTITGDWSIGFDWVSSSSPTAPGLIISTVN